MLDFDSIKNRFLEHNVESGDLLVVQGKGDFLSNIIRLLTGSRFVHTAMLIKLEDQFFVLEAKLGGGQFPVKILTFQCWLLEYKLEQIYIAKKPNNKLFNEDKLKSIVFEMNSIRPYGLVFLLLVYFLQDWLGIRRPKVMSKSKPIICSTIIQEIWEEMGLINKHYYYSPGDLVHMLGGSDALISLDVDCDVHGFQESKRLNFRSQCLLSNYSKSPMLASLLFFLSERKVLNN